jgi:hypothetical protein
LALAKDRFGARITDFRWISREGGALNECADGGRIKRLSASPMSALKRITDSTRTSRHVRKMPTADVIKEAANCGGLTFSKAVSGLC